MFQNTKSVDDCTKSLDLFLIRNLGSPEICKTPSHLPLMTMTITLVTPNLISPPDPNIQPPLFLFRMNNFEPFSTLQDSQSLPYSTDSSHQLGCTAGLRIVGKNAQHARQIGSGHLLTYGRLRVHRIGFTSDFLQPMRHEENNSQAKLVDG